MRRKLRDWQQKALEVYLQSIEDGRRSILWEATPGAGKTIAAMRLCLHQLKKLQARRVIIVVPTTHLKIQWARAAMEFGLHLDAQFSDKQRRIAKDYHGIVLTYQQIANRPKVFHRLSEQAVVVLDEVHHSGDGLSWGDALRVALKDASFILCLSGTAFRSDNNTIPFIRYNEAGVSEPDFVYAYSAAIQDTVCRPTVFFTYGGDVSWRDGELQMQARFSDALDRVGRTRRLRAALDPSSGWIEPMLQDAHTMLQAVRHEHPEAAALLTASSQLHARSLARVLHTVTGEKPIVVLSDDANASQLLKDFNAGTQPWLVACNMVSEGVDIPRLRVGVYATAIRTKMYFRQFLGRIVRRTAQPQGVQPAFFYLPADPWLQRLAEEVEHEQRHCIQARSQEEFFPFQNEDSERERPERLEPSWQATGAVNSGIDQVIMGGGQLSLWQTEDVRSREAVSSMNEMFTLHNSFAAQPAFPEGMELAGANSNQILPDSPSNEILSTEPHKTGPLSRAELKEAIAKEIRLLVSRYHKDTGRPHSHIHALLNRKQSVASQKECTERQLKERLHLLEELIVTSDVVISSD